MARRRIWCGPQRWPRSAAALTRPSGRHGGPSRRLPRWPRGSSARRSSPPAQGSPRRAHCRALRWRVLWEARPPQCVRPGTALACSRGRPQPLAPRHPRPTPADVWACRHSAGGQHQRMPAQPPRRSKPHGPCARPGMSRRPSLLESDAPGLSPATLSRLKQGWQEEVLQWQHRDLAGRRYGYFWVDGVYFDPTLTPARYMLGLIPDKIIACGIFA
jgi:hypothetical protein